MNIILSQLRSLASFLNYDLFRVGIVSDPSCRCGAALENLKHFFLDCPIYLQASSPFHKNSITIVLTFSLKIILRQFLSPFHKDYLTTNFNLTTKITLTIKNSSLGVLDTILCDKVCQ